MADPAHTDAEEWPMQRSLSISFAWSVCVMVAMAGPAAAGAAAESAKKRPASVITHCVGSGPPIAFKPHDSRALLEPEDRDGVHAAIAQRYPVLGGAAPAPAHIMLWHKGADEWLYVSLAAIEARKRKPPGLCFTATVRANDFEFTRELIQKYFAGVAAPV